MPQPDSVVARGRILSLLALLAGPVLGGLGGVAMLAAQWPADAAWAVTVTVWVVAWWILEPIPIPATDRKSTRLNSSHYQPSRMPSSA